MIEILTNHQDAIARYECLICLKALLSKDLNIEYTVLIEKIAPVIMDLL